MADWETVTILRKKPPKASAMKSEQVGMFVALTYIIYDAPIQCTK
jgi:hypothetical protein